MIETETKRVLITGASGFIGSNLARYLLNCGYEIYVVIRKSSNLWRLNDIASDIQIQYIVDSSPEEFSYILESAKPDILINSIGADQNKNLRDDTSIWSGNFIILTNIARALKKLKNIFFIQSGSSFEYGRATIEHNPLSEEVRCDPVSEYGISKLYATDYLSYLGKNWSLSTAVLRIFNVYGPYENGNRLVPDLIIRSLLSSAILLKNPSVRRDFIHISDVAEAFRSTIVKEDRLRNGSLVVNIGTGISSSVEEVANVVNKITGNNMKIETESSDKRPENYIPGPVADNKKARSVLDWKPKLTIDNGLKETIGWFKDHKELYQKF